MMTKRWRTVLISSIILLLIAAVGTASANTKYASNTGKECSACHDMAKIPALNSFGQQYKSNGYKIPAAQPAAQPAPKPATKPAAQPTAAKLSPYSAYVGSERCGTCHADYYKNWQTTSHSKMIQKRDVGILKDAVNLWVYDLTGNKGPTIANVTKDSKSILDVEYVVGGNKWKQRYMVRNPKTGGLQFLNKQFNMVSKQWEPYGNANDWDTMCITCHSTGYRLTAYDEKNPAATKWAVGELNVGCEACHGPGSWHADSGGKLSIWNPAKQPKDVQARACGACHVRIENEKFLSKQGKPREDLVNPTLNLSRKPWDDWTKWYPEELIAPGIQAEDKIDAAYTGDLKGLFFTDETAAKQGSLDEKKHHQQYQGFIQSKHNNNLTCTTCHNPHKRTATTGTLKAAPASLCANCHGNAVEWQKTMPGTGSTVNNLYVRAHTFDADQSRESGPTSNIIQPERYFK